MKSSLLKKTRALFWNVPRRIHASFATETAYRRNPPVIANSFPKSGTNLLKQVLGTLPEIRNLDTVVASMPSVPHVERSPADTMQLLRRITPRELVFCHLFYSDRFSQYLSSIHATHYFIYRDPRDVVLSEVHYLTRMNRWHSLHQHFKQLPNDHERIQFAITGSEDAEFPIHYPDLRQRFERYRGWLTDTNVMPVRYEDLNGPDRRNWIFRILQHHLTKLSARDSVRAEELVDAAIANAAPSNSSTFYRGGSGRWQDEFSAANKKKVEEVLGNLLVELGYD